MLKYCPACLDIHRAEDKYCWNCGSELTTTPPRVCPKCHRALEKPDKYCPSCGTKVR